MTSAALGDSSHNDKYNNRYRTQTKLYSRRHYGVTCAPVGVNPTNICTTDPTATCDRITVGVFVGGRVGGRWTAGSGAISPRGPAMQRLLFPETVPGAEVWPTIDDGCFMGADNRKLIAGCNRFARRTTRYSLARPIKAK